MLALSLALAQPRAAGGSPPLVGGSVALREHLSASAKTEAEAIETHFVTNDWAPDLASVVWDDTVPIADGGELFRWLRNNLSIGGVVLNPARNQRIQLAAAGNFAFNAPNQTGGGTAGLLEIRGRDYLGNGKVLLIEPATTSPNITQRLSISGCRGVYVRNLRFVGGGDDWGLDWQNWAPTSVHTLNITAGGTGYVTGEVLTFTGTYDQAPAGTIIATAGVVTGVNITFGGKYVRDQASGVTNITGVGVATAGGSGATFTVPAQQASPRDTPCIFIQRNTSNPLMSVVVFDNCDIGKGHVGTNPQQFAVGISCVNQEQLTVIGCRFYGYETGLSCTSVRRLRAHRNDFQGAIGDAIIHLHTNVNTVVTGGQTFGTAFPDAIAYSWARLNTARAIVDDCARTNVQGEDLRFDQAHTDFFQNGTSGDNGSYKTLIEFNAVYFERETWQDRNGSFRNNSASTVRVTGGTQGTYFDDSASTFTQDTVQHSNLIAVNTSNALVTYQGTSFVERNTGVRVGRMAPSATTVPDGFNFSQDFNVDLTMGRKDASATATIHVRDNIMGGISTYPPNRNVTATTDAGNVTANPRLTASVGERYVDLFAGTFTTVNGLNGYTFTDTGANSQAAFRAALYAQFTPIGAAVGKGAPDPSLWPST